MLGDDSDAAIDRRSLLKAAGLGALGLPVGAAASGSSRRAASTATDAAAVQQSGATDWLLKRHNVASLKDGDGIDVADLTDSERSNLVTANGDNGEAHVWEWNEADDSWSSTRIYSGGTEIEGALAHDLDGDGVPEVYLMDQGAGELVRVTRVDDAGDEWDSWVWDDAVDAVQTARVYERPGEEPEEALYVAYEGSDEDDGGIKRYWYSEEFDETRSRITGSASYVQVPRSEWILHHPGAWGLSIEQRDLDGDGTLEFLLGARGSKNNDYGDGLGLYYVTSDPHGSWSSEVIDRYEGGTRAEYDPIGYSHVYFGDMTGDGVRKDIVACGWPAQDEAGHWFEYDDDFSHHTLGDADDKYWNAKPFDIGEGRDAVVLCHKVEDSRELELYVYDDVGDWTRRSGHPTKKADDQLPAVDFGDGAVNFASVSAKSNDLDWWEIKRAGAGEPAIGITKYPILDDDLGLTAVGFPHSTDESTYEWQVFESAALETRVATGEGQQMTTTLPDGSYFVAVRAEREDGEIVTAYRTVEAGSFPAPVAYGATVLDGGSFGALGFNVFRDDGRIYVKPSGENVAKGDYEFDVRASDGTIEDVQKDSWNDADSIDTSADDRVTGDGSIGRNGGFDQFSFTTDADALTFDLRFVSNHAPGSPDEQRLEFVHLGGDGQMPAASPVRIEFDNGPIEDIAWSGDDGSWSGDAGDGDDGTDDEDCLEFLPDDRTPTAAELRAYNKCLNRNEQGEDDGSWSGDAGDGDGGSWSGDA